MPVYLSKDERDLVARYTKAQKPKYYSLVAGQEVEISEDMEKFIILSPRDARNKIVAWIQDNNKKTRDKEDRESLLKELLDAELQDAQAALDEATAGLENYDNFIDSYFKNVIPEDSGSTGTQLKPKRERFGDVAEVGQALSDVSRSVEEFIVTRDRAKHLLVITSCLQKIISDGNLSREEKRQVSSWATPFSAYTNGRT